MDLDGEDSIHGTTHGTILTITDGTTPGDTDMPIQAGTALGTHHGDGEAGIHLSTIVDGTTLGIMVVTADIMVDITEADMDTVTAMDTMQDLVAADRAAAQQDIDQPVADQTWHAQAEHHPDQV